MQAQLKALIFFAEMPNFSKILSFPIRFTLHNVCHLSIRFWETNFRRRMDLNHAQTRGIAWADTQQPIRRQRSHACPRYPRIVEYTQGVSHETVSPALSDELLTHRHSYLCAAHEKTHATDKQAGTQAGTQTATKAGTKKDTQSHKKAHAPKHAQALACKHEGTHLETLKKVRIEYATHPL